MSDKERTPKAEKPEIAGDEETTRKDAAEDSAAEDSAEEGSAGARVKEDAPSERQDEAAARMAEALGVDEGERKAADAEEEEAAAVEAQAPKAAAQNRAVRRREGVRKRRGESAEDLPRDRNARAKELLKRRQEQASERQGRVGSQLDTGEMVEDVLARATSRSWKWIRQNFALVQMVLVGGVLVTGVVLFFLYRSDAKSGAVSGTLAAAVAADRGRVLAEDKRSDEEKALDPTKVYKTPEERADAALAAYRKVVEEKGSPGAVVLARLGEAGALLDKKEWGPALEAYSAVASSTLAGVDPDVKGRAVEGMGFAKEGQKDLDGALAHFKELEGIDGRGYKELGLYHQARIHLAKGDKEKAKELLKAAREKLGAPGSTEKGPPFLTAMVDEALRQIDPSAVPAQMPMPTQLGGGGANAPALSKEDLDRLIEQAKANAKKQMNPPPGEVPAPPPGEAPAPPPGEQPGGQPE
ncbi:hypothetical protein [Chondromyces apiculatus]|uniref:Tetratricopeptide repeat-like domain-containing protein n=1 Tax=Chondromyces apiculatus DSM 436 TaxID=1192034 RepID=A0A017SYD6_9BACT|nr:hypothetical protein [Chondromyces apiculatus]EYF01605.1 Hypothetical protein CAP_7924 [Chondromyces apiculatus DSM 436]